MTSSAARYLLLDIGMVLVGLNHNRLAKRMHEFSGLEPMHLQAVLAADGLVQKLETGKISGVHFYEEVCSRLGVRITWGEFLEAWNSIFEQPLLSDDLLVALAKNVRLWVISNTNELHFEYMTRHFTFLHHFEGLILSHQVGLLKPDARIFTLALERMQALPSDVVFVDDQEVNVQVARKLGIDSCCYQDPEQLEAELRARNLI